ncbi:MAG TPA: fenitrothion hydrolase [Baekduia sp.]
MKRLRRLLALAAALAVAAPATAEAHGLAGRTDLPVPGWAFAWGACLVLVLSFVALGTLWPTPRLEREQPRPVLRLPAALDVVAGIVGVAGFVAIVYCGLHGSQTPLANLAPTSIYVVFWVGIPIVSLVLGDVFRPFNPWRAVARAARAAARALGVRQPRAPLSYPERLGLWPAALGLLGFAWLELVLESRDQPSLLAWLALAYAAVQLAGMGLFGIAAWSDRGDAFGVYFGLAARLAPLTVRGRELCVRRPLTGLTEVAPLPGTVAVVCVLIGSTSFDGAANGLWKQVGPSITRGFAGLGAGPVGADELAGTFGLLAAVGLIAAAYLIGVRGMTRATGGTHLAGRFVHSMAPIAMAYVVAHYFSLVVFQGQGMEALISDPLGNGADLLGTSGDTINYSVISTSMIWYVQIAALLAGHVGGLILAHDRALVLFKGRTAVRSQYWMLAVMVGFTSLGLWLLSTVST